MQTNSKVSPKLLREVTLRLQDSPNPLVSTSSEDNPEVQDYTLHFGASSVDTNPRSKTHQSESGIQEEITSKKLQALIKLGVA